HDLAYAWRKKLEGHVAERDAPFAQLGANRIVPHAPPVLPEVRAPSRLNQRRARAGPSCRQATRAFGSCLRQSGKQWGDTECRSFWARGTIVIAWWRIG